MSRTHTYRSSTKTHQVARAAAWALVVLCALAGSALAGEQDDKARNSNPTRHEKAKPYKDRVRVKAVAAKPVKLPSAKPGPSLEVQDAAASAGLVSRVLAKGVRRLLVVRLP